MPPKTINMNHFRATRPTLAQFEAMLEFMENNLNLVNGRLTFNFTVKDRNRLWEELATVLNSQVNGAVKVSSKWRKTWHDWKSSVKSRAAGFRICEGKRIRGTPGEQPLSQLDLRLLNLIGSASANSTTNGFFSISNVKSLEDSMIFTIAEEEPQQSGTEKVGNPSSSPSLDSTPGMHNNSLAEEKSEHPSQIENASTAENNSTQTATATNTQPTEDKFEYFSPIVLTTIVDNNDVGESETKEASSKANDPPTKDKIQYFSSLVLATSDQNNAIGKEAKSKADLVITSSMANKIENISTSPIVTFTDGSETKLTSYSINSIPTKTESIKSVVMSNGHVPLIFTANSLPIKESNITEDSNNKRKRTWEKSKEKDNPSYEDFELPTLLKEAVSVLRRISRANEETAVAQTRIAVANERKAAAAERMAAAAERRATAAERRATAAERTSAAAERASNAGV